LGKSKEKKISWIDISFTVDNGEETKLESEENFKKKAEEWKNLNRGFISIKGKNGSGKSSILLYLKSKWVNSILVPAASDSLMFKSNLTSNSGDKKLKQLKELLETPELQYHPLLLDEWNANLDKENRKEWSQKLLEASKERLILEVNHHGEEEV